MGESAIDGQDGSGTASLYQRGALYILGVLDAAPEAVFDDLAMLAMEVCGAPGAEITFTDGPRQVRKAAVGRLDDPAGAAAVGRALPVTLRSGMAVGQLLVHGPAPAPASVGMLERIARQVGAVLDERLAANWHDGGALTIGVAVVDATGRLLSGSPDLEHAFGWSVVDLVGTSMMELIHPEDLEAAAVAFERTSEARGLKAPYDVRIRCRDGSWASVELTADNRLDDPDINGIIYTVRDQHDRPRGENMLAREAEILQLIAQGGPLGEVAAAVAKLLDELIADGMGCVMGLDPDGATLSPLGYAALPAAFAAS